jgi:ABC-type dipeptide/oligopeptide/nickel transport system permease subunit
MAADQLRAVPGVVGLHLGIGLTMGLDYSAQALAVIIVFVNWIVVVESIRATILASRRKPPRRVAGVP